MSQRLLIAGLGNPGDKYSETRHNAGFWFLDRLIREVGGSLRRQGRLSAEVATASFQGGQLVLFKPTTFMNESGRAVRAVLDFYKCSPDCLLVAHDELDLPPGTAKLKCGGGHGGNNGLRSIISHLGQPDFNRLRIGIGHPGSKDRVTPYVLSRPSRIDELAIRESIEQAVAVLPEMMDGAWERAMNRLHTR